jgi:heme exporter protein A
LRWWRGPYPAKISAMSALTATNLACDRGGRRVFADISFTLRPGEALQVEGANGAGKSSLLRLLGGLLTPYRVAWAGHEVALKPGVTLAAELDHWARLDGAASDAVTAALAAFDLTPLGHLPAGILSSGQRRRAALARAMASGVELWLLDEPGVGLDTASLALLANAIAAQRARGGLVVAVTHTEIGIEAPQRLRLGTPSQPALRRGT